MKFPLFIDIKDKDILIIGAGRVGCRRIRVLLGFGAKISVISPQIADKELIPLISYTQRCYEDGDIASPFLVIAATNDRAVNRQISSLCNKLDIPVSVADSRQESTFYFPAICKSDTLTVGIISDSGAHTEVASTAKEIRGKIL